MSGSSHLEVKVVPKNFVKFTGKHVAGRPQIFRNFQGQFFTGHLRTDTSERALFHDYSEKKNIFKATKTVFKSKGNTCTSLN